MVKVGTNLSLYCTAHGLPNPTVQWYKGSQPIKSEKKAFLKVPTQSPHTTLYTCIGRNTIGNTPANITVIIEGMQNYVVTLPNMFYSLEICPPSPAAPVNGKKLVIPDSAGFEKYAVFSSDDGYNLQGSSLTECKMGRWSSSSSVCVVA